MPMRTRNSPPHTPARRAVAVYVLVVGIATLLVVTGLTLVAVARADHRIRDALDRSVQARDVALAGIEHALTEIHRNDEWRHTLPDDTWFRDTPFGPGAYSVTAADIDGDPEDDENDPLRLTSTGTVGGAVHTVQVTISPRPVEAFRYACFAQTDIDFRTSAVIRGPVRAHATITSDGSAVLQENASFETLTGFSITPSLTPASYTSRSISYPQPDLSLYLSLATPISGEGLLIVKLSRYALTPTLNSESPAQVNPNGIYALNAAGRIVVIEQTRIKGTLIIYNTIRTVTFQHACVLEPASLAYPTVLIYTGGAAVELNLDQSPLSEAGEKTDFNGDGDTTDSFPTAIRGVLWTQGSYVEMHKSTADFKGCLIADSLRIHSRAVIDDDPALIQQLMPGFVEPEMKIVPGSWREVQP